MRRVAVIFFAGLALGTGNPAAEIHHDFRQRRFNDQVVRLEGPTPSRYVKREDAGLRISLPRPEGPKKPTGFTFQFVLRGDFEVAVSYEVLKDEPPPPGKSVGVTTYLMFDTPAQDGITFGRFQRTDGPPVYALNHMVRAEGGRRKSRQSATFPTSKLSMTGSLRVIRHGPMLTLAAASARSDSYSNLTTVEVGPSDVKMVRIAADPDGTDTPVEVRVADFRVRADELITPSQAVATRSAGRARAWLLWGVAGVAILLTTTVIVRAGIRRWRANAVVSPDAPIDVSAKPGDRGHAS